MTLRSASLLARPLSRGGPLGLQALRPLPALARLHTTAHTHAAAAAPAAAGAAGTDAKQAAFNVVLERPLPAPRSTDPAYFTGNPNYYSHLRQLNALIRKHAIGFRSTPATTRSWKSLKDMSDSLNMRLKENDYVELVHKLNLLFPLLAQDIEVKHLLEKFVPVGDALERPAPVRPVLDKDGRSYTTGSRKTARAQCWLVKGDGHVYVNGVKLNEYFAERTDAEAVIRPFEAVDQLAQYNVWAIVQGGGPSGQASAIGVAVARGVAVHDPATEPVLKELGLTKIDTRQVERKKTGQPKARKKNAWVKR